jgi:hypothetical protein
VDDAAFRQCMSHCADTRCLRFTLKEPMTISCGRSSLMNGDADQFSGGSCGSRFCSCVSVLPHDRVCPAEDKIG